MEEVVISEPKSGQRIDKFLKKEFFLNTEVTRGEIIRQIKEGSILVNNSKTKPSYSLKTGETISFNIQTPIIQLFPNFKIKIEVIFENEDFAIINKTAGLQVHPSNRNEKDTLVNGLIIKFPEIKLVGDNPQNRPGIVHRLDKDTSGLMIIAKKQKTFLNLKEQFKKRTIEKKYWAVVFGIPEKKQGSIDKEIARSTNYKKQVIAGKKTKTKIRKALTQYQILQNFSNYSLLEVTPKTGRMHQIRVHLFSIKHPIVGDKLYQLKRNSSNLFDKVSRQLLHAQEIKFELQGKKYQFNAPLPKDFKDFLNRLDEKEIKG